MATVVRVLLTLACLLKFVLCNFEPPELNYKPFHAAIRKALLTSKSHNTVSAIKPNVSATTDCVMPESSIMFTYANRYMMELVVLQHKAMEVWNMKECLESRFITVCLDTGCMEICRANNINNCAAMLAAEIPASEFGKNAYNFFTYLKHDLMREALHVVNEVFFFDADVVIFRNPWIESTYGRDEQGRYVDGPYDMMWQRDRGRGPGCSGSVNSGVMYVRNSTRAQAYFGYMGEVKDKILQGGHGLDQDFVANASETAGLRFCALSGTLFTTHCLQVFGNIKYIDSHFPLSKIITYHTACVQGLGPKKNYLSKMIAGVSAKDRPNTISGYVRHKT